MNEAEKITKKSKSNLAFTFFALPKARRRDISVFYAFCRRIDDAADDPNISLEQRRSWLQRWRQWLREPTAGESTFAPDVRSLIESYRIDISLFDEIIDGVAMDLEPVRFATYKELEVYCYRVASAVGLVSIEIFGYRNPVCREYAYNLGQALQLTNIMRDVETDWREGGRIYLPLDEIARFGYSEQLLRKRVYNSDFVRLMQFQAERARDFYQRARSLLPREDRQSMVAAEGMKGIYLALLRQMEADKFRVFDRRYRLSKARKTMIILREFASNKLGWSD
jgi:15-cis-phytoene synthase